MRTFILNTDKFHWRQFCGNCHNTVS